MAGGQQGGAKENGGVVRDMAGHEGRGCQRRSLYLLGSPGTQWAAIDHQHHGLRRPEAAQDHDRLAKRSEQNRAALERSGMYYAALCAWRVALLDADGRPQTKLPNQTPTVRWLWQGWLP